MFVNIVILANIVAGLFAIGLQIETYLINWYDDAPVGSDHVFFSWDVIASGIWGGVFIILTSIFLLKRSLNRYGIVVLCAICALCGLTMIGLYSWAINTYVKEFLDPKGFPTCYEVHQATNLKACDYLAIDAMFIIVGCIILLINIVLICMTETIVATSTKR